ncbi:natural cytotoxicity triggering receptor 3 ligand 1-like [Acipenser oxyrinchus oxyrinchus]|uniref:Natural cytotoxicity triggering receptor 3 ligand 1-like n=1 Tax=Acipenser oxyrinchus oxyrinchus TaxID=40147 RepID=A0AAD8FS93_ACIOX|nr:natural cytotoxicity triggering receptor 3 ligand 1-like [Acipenser oxyrinchus oxyrinchus]
MRAHWGTLCQGAFCLLSVTVISAIEILLSPQSLSILLGQTARFTCSIGKGMGCHKDVFFFWSHNETQINNTVKNIKHRISIIDSHLSSSLFIANVTPSDYGQYSCSVLCLADPPLLLEKRSAQLEVKVKAIPKLDLRYAVSADRAGVLILSCSAVGFYPRDVTLSWDSSPPGLPSSTQQGPPTVNQDGSYSTSTSLQVNEALWSPGTEISCVLNHSSLAQPQREYIRRGEVQLTVGSVNESSGLLILSCSAVGFYPRDVTLSWDSSPPGLPYSTQQGPPTVNQDGSYSTSTSLQVNEALWSPGTEISCVLNHSSLAQPLREFIRRGEVQLTVGSVNESSGLLILSCSAVGFYPRDVTLSWDSSPPGLLSFTQQGPPTVNQDGSYSTSTSLQVNEALWSQGTEISCVLNHSSLAQPSRKGMRKPSNKKTIMFNQYLYTLLLPALILPCCVYLLMKALRNRQDADPASCGDKEMGKEEDGGLHYASVTHRHRKQQKQRRVERAALEDEEQAVYSAVRGREGAAAASEDSLQYASLDLHSIPRRTGNEEDQQCTVYT